MKANFKLSTDEDNIFDPFEDIDTDEKFSENKGTYNPERYQKLKVAKHAAEEKAHEAFQRLICILKDNDLWEGLAPDLKDFISNEGKFRRQTNSKLIDKLFPSIRKGDKITLAEAVTRTLKGKAAIDKAIALFNAKGGLQIVTIESVEGEPLKAIYEVQ